MSDGFKGGVHFVMGGLACTMALYQGLRLIDERENRAHLWVNIAVYVPLFVFEGLQARRHWS